MTERERLTTERRKIFARESLTLMSMPKDELRRHYNEIFDRLQEYEVAEENNQIIVPPCMVGDTVYQVTRNFISEFRVRFIEISTCGNLFLHTNLINGIVYTGEIFSKSEIGKTIFLTKEEAEKALKGGVE